MSVTGKSRFRGRGQGPIAAPRGRARDRSERASVPVRLWANRVYSIVNLQCFTTTYSTAFARRRESSCSKSDRVAFESGTRLSRAFGSGACLPSTPLASSSVLRAETRAAGFAVSSSERAVSICKCSLNRGSVFPHGLLIFVGVFRPRETLGLVPCPIAHGSGALEFTFIRAASNLRPRRAGHWTRQDQRCGVLPREKPPGLRAKRQSGRAQVAGNAFG
jgi:hypothetical protein